jgi:hypothetical protein
MTGRSASCMYGTHTSFRYNTSTAHVRPRDPCQHKGRQVAGRVQRAFGRKRVEAKERVALGGRRNLSVYQRRNKVERFALALKDAQHRDQRLTDS